MLSICTERNNKTKIPRLFYKSKSTIIGGNNKLMLYSNIEKSIFIINGNENTINANSLEIINSSISITGNNNEIIIEDKTKLSNCNIIVRGTGCKILIDSQTTFGGARIINVGINNAIQIGKNCLFADHIEIWASDTHSIYDAENQMINPECPIMIKDNVWIGAHVKILKGVTINRESVIGIGTIVTKDVPANTISAGNPNRVIKDGVNWKLDYPIN